jgi:hypothetical protein
LTNGLLLYLVVTYFHLYGLLEDNKQSIISRFWDICNTLYRAMVWAGGVGISWTVDSADVVDITIIDNLFTYFVIFNILFFSFIIMSVFLLLLFFQYYSVYVDLYIHSPIQLKCSLNVTKNMYLLQCNNFDDTLILNSS